MFTELYSSDQGVLAESVRECKTQVSVLYLSRVGHDTQHDKVTANPHNRINLPSLKALTVCVSQLCRVSHHQGARALGGVSDGTATWAVG